MSERCIGKPVEAGISDLLHRTDALCAEAFRSSQRRILPPPRDELMGHDDVAFPPVDLRVFQDDRDRILIGFDLCPGEKALHLGRLHKRKKADVDFRPALFLFYYMLLKVSVKDSADIDLVFFEQPAAIVQPVIGIMVPADHKGLYLP